MEIWSPNSEAYKNLQKRKAAHKRNEIILSVYNKIKLAGVGFACVCSFIFVYIVWS